MVLIIFMVCLLQISNFQTLTHGEENNKGQIRDILTLLRRNSNAKLNNADDGKIHENLYDITPGRNNVAIELKENTGEAHKKTLASEFLRRMVRNFIALNKVRESMKENIETFVSKMLSSKVPKKTTNMQENVRRESLMENMMELLGKRRERR